MQKQKCHKTILTVAQSLPSTFTLWHCSTFSWRIPGW